MMSSMDCLLVLLVLTDFLLLGSSRLAASIRIAAIQGFLVGLLPVVAGGFEVTLRLALMGAAFAGLKGFVFPHLLSRNLRDSSTSREVQPFVGYTQSIILGVVSLVACFWLDSRLHLPVGAESTLVIPFSFSMMITGLFLIIARRTAINQVLGYLVLENGIYAFGLAMVGDIPVLVELGVLMDLFVAVFVMGIAIYRITREFDHMDSDQLNLLKD